MLIKFVLPVYIVACQACASISKEDIATNQDYLPSLLAVKRNEPGSALQKFHQKESDGFITTTEKGFLGIISGNAEIEPLRKVAAELEKRKTLSISQSAESFFYKEYEDGYYPAEHEAVALHLITAMAYAQAGLRHEALVETRRAAFYLEAQYAHHREPFDDAGLRLWLAALWTYGGEWEHARVDLRVAGRLLKNSHLQELAEQPRPPRQLDLMLLGPGPNVVWPDGDVFDIEFKMNHRQVPLALVSESGDRSPVRIDVDNARWYERHKRRNRAIQDVIEESRYMTHASTHAVAAGATMAAGTVASAGLLIASVAIGAGVVVGGIYVAQATASSELGGLVAAAGLAIGYHGATLAGQSMQASHQTASEIAESGFNKAIYYRFVRFLPDRIALHWHHQSRENTQLEILGSRPVAPFLQVDEAKNNTRVRFFHAVDPAAQNFDIAGYRPHMWIQPSSPPRLWVLYPALATGEEAAEACKKISQNSQYKFRVPAGAEVSTALQAGVANPRSNQPFGADLQRDLIKHRKAWVQSVSNTGRTCQTIDGSDYSISVGAECKMTLPLLCVAYGERS